VDWFACTELVQSLPWGLRSLAAYFRLASSITRPKVMGGSFLLRRVSRLRRLAGRADDAFVSVRGRRWCVRPDDPRILWVLEELVSPRPEFSAFGALLGPGDTFVDLGANQGAFSFRALEVIGVTGRLVAVEPQPRLAANLRRSFAANGQSSADVLELACGERAADARFFVPAAGSGSAGLFPEHSAAQEHVELSVRVAPIDDALPWGSLPGRILVKLDLEGAEVQCLRGARQFLRARRPALLLEVSPTTLGAAGHGADDLVRELRALGYTRAIEAREFPRASPLERLLSGGQRNVFVMHGDATQ
jgi:FkbM family methyltransferase